MSQQQTQQRPGQQTGTSRLTARKKPRGKPFTGRDDPRLRQNMEATGRLPKGPDVLGTERVADLEAMEYVTSHGEDETHQRAYFRRLMEREPKWFADRL